MDLNLSEVHVGLFLVANVDRGYYVTRRAARRNDNFVKQENLGINSLWLVALQDNLVSGRWKRAFASDPQSRWSRGLKVVNSFPIFTSSWFVCHSNVNVTLSGFPFENCKNILYDDLPLWERQAKRVASEPSQHSCFKFIVCDRPRRSMTSIGNQP